MLDRILHKIQAATRQARSEAALQIMLEPILKELLSQYGIVYAPSVNETLKSLGLSQTNSTRPDSLFGHVVLDYKAPHHLSSPRELIKAKDQIEAYLDSVTVEDHSLRASVWSGVLWDGASIALCHSNGEKWIWSPLREISEPTLLTLVSTYRALQRRPLTPSSLAVSFGKDAPVARRLLTTMCGHLSKPKHRTAMLFREWKRLFEQVSTFELDQLPGLRSWAMSLGIATKDASQILFAIHSYYALVVKLLTSELLGAVNPAMPRSACESLANAENGELYAKLVELEDGEFWRRLRISNFLEGDFFSWYADEKSAFLAGGIRELAREFLQFEPATAIIKPEAIADLLKEFYTTLVDEQIRHDLGEYYTPDWLAAHLLDRLGYDGDPEKVVLDPACGSGTFLVECIARIRHRADVDGSPGKRELLKTIVHAIKGMDLNPLAVISARANFILATADLVFEVGEDFELPIFLADCINVPVEKQSSDGLSVFSLALDTELGSFAFEIPAALVSQNVLGQVLLACEDAIKSKSGMDAFRRSLHSIPGLDSVMDQRVESRLARLFEIVTQLEERDWNRIWCRILKNNLSPKSFAGAADLIVGNPPWVRWSRLPQSYRDRAKQFCNYYGLVSGRGYTGGIETDISTVVLYSSADNWLKMGGRIGMLMTWTVFKSGSARGFRLGRLPDGSGLRVDEISNLNGIQPFPDATNETSIYIATKVTTAEEAEGKRVPCYLWKPNGTVRINPRSTLEQVRVQVSIAEGIASPVSDWGSPLWTGGMAGFAESKLLRGASVYAKMSHRGTISDLARVYWVKVERFSNETGRALVRTLREDELRKARSIQPVEGAWIEAELLHPLVRGRDVGRYCFHTDGWYQIVPNRHYENVESEEEFAEKFPCAYSYFANYRELLLNRATYRRYQKHLPFYVIYCVGEYSFKPWKVAWMEQQNPAEFRCSVISAVPSAKLTNRIVVPDHKLYFADMGSAEEAHYLAGFLNSHPVRSWLGGFLLGKQIGTTIFEFTRVPKFQRDNPSHRRVSAISAAACRSRQDNWSSNALDAGLESELAELVKRIAGDRNSNPT